MQLFYTNVFLKIKMLTSEMDRFYKQQTENLAVLPWKRYSARFVSYHLNILFLFYIHHIKDKRNY